MHSWLVITIVQFIACDHSHLWKQSQRRPVIHVWHVWNPSKEKAHWLNIWEFTQVKNLMCAHCVTSHLVKKAPLPITLEFIQMSPRIYVRLVGNPSKRIVLWLNIYEFIQTNVLTHASFVASPSVKTSLLQITWGFIQRRRLIRVIPVGNPSNWEEHWLHTWGFTQVNALMRALFVRKPSVNMVSLQDTS